MKVFISWSGRRSHEVANALAGWLKKVIQSAEPWVSSDIERGVKWLAEIGKSLDAHSIGILCVTPGNISAPWLNFEAGALSRQISDDVRVIPYLLDFRSASELQPPLGQFNASLADESGTHDLVKTLNAHSEPKLSEADLDETFKMWWPSLRDKLDAIRSSGSGQPPKRRATDDKIDELLDLTRQLTRRLSPSRAEIERHNMDVFLASSAIEPSREIIASKTAVEMLEQAGIETTSIAVLDKRPREIVFNVSGPLDNSVTQRIRERLKEIVPNPPRIWFYAEETDKML